MEQLPTTHVVLIPNPLRGQLLAYRGKPEGGVQCLGPVDKADIEAAGLLHMIPLHSPGGHAMFTNDMFTRISQARAERLYPDNAQLAAIVNKHRHHRYVDAEQTRLFGSAQEQDVAHCHIEKERLDDGERSTTAN